jgi:DNA repair exonuclease SbcCD ATPase subunit
MSSWFLERLEIEGVRGINNEGDPLVLNFAHDAVNSVSAPNGVGKSSIFDALTYALRKKISKLDDLPATENGGSLLSEPIPHKERRDYPNNCAS